MPQRLPIIIIAALCLIQSSIAQYPPPVTYDTVLKSPINPNITISFKTPDNGTCVTAFPYQKQYTGYVNLPPYTLTPYQQNYSINTFFWFIESRESPETAPLTIWLNGGPGSSSMYGLFAESGPCEVVQLPDGSYGTQARLWGWDRSSNVLFIDQPTQTGFSYDDLVNASVSLIDNERYEPPKPLPKGMSPFMFLNGTFASDREGQTQNTSTIAASASWHFLQGFLSTFPQYNPGVHPNNTVIKAAGIHLFAESYGGMYGPAFADFFETQNAKRARGEISNSTLEIQLASLGIINGMLDTLIQAPWWPKFAYENTYEIRAIDQTTELNILSDFRRSGGCNELVERCRGSMATLDPLGEGDEKDTNELCSKALQACRSLLAAALAPGRSPYDIRNEGVELFPGGFLEYLNTADVQKSIGAKVNFTADSESVLNAFIKTGDEIRGTQLTSLSKLLDKGIRVAFIYGDADVICNWKGGEAVSIELARLLPEYGPKFPAAGYADIVVNSSYVGGQVRQFGNLSFARIYDAGHTVPEYQPETAFTVFTRILKGTDIGMGKDIDLSEFETKGPSDSKHKNKVPELQKHTCWIRNFAQTCNQDDVSAMSESKGVVKYGVFYADEKDYTPLSTSVLAGKPGSPPTATPTQAQMSTSTVPLTGVYTASETPKVTSGASRLSIPFQVQKRQDLSPLSKIGSTPTNERARTGRLKKYLIITAATFGTLLLV
ncbi:carboxypeptidase S1 [Westerdykella ornata]|uniref:Carboxypeptidase n=1 Tax=Westerdykella ornata TaxID=318751 RepID=A0A6A6JP01_WESOR|nr:carboxypeptidase S1 [Westerdykella ornata]KAF2276669.1 carboxypeptidase S1 [Westerdykella ornata]